MTTSSCVAYPGVARFKSKATLSAVLVVCASILLTSAGWQNAGAADKEDFNRRLYLGAGLGISGLDPNPRQKEILHIGDDSDRGFHIYLGYDINRWFSAELYLANLGEAGIDRIDTPNEQVDIDRIDYRIADLSALAYVFNSKSGFIGSGGTDGVFCRQSLSLFTRLGLGIMRNNDTTGVVPHGRNYSQHVSFGAGVEYGFRNGFGLRAEWTSFDSDANYAGLSVVKRLGRSTCERPVEDGMPRLGESKPVIPPDVPTKTTDTRNKSPDRDRIIAPTGYFGFDQSTPDAASVAELIRFAAAIAERPGLLYLTGHTDSIGPRDYNQGLSERRVHSVRRLLLDGGIDKARIRIDYRGEMEPAEDNDTAAGRALNRRVTVALGS